MLNNDLTNKLDATKLQLGNGISYLSLPSVPNYVIYDQKIGSDIWRLGVDVTSNKHMFIQRIDSNGQYTNIMGINGDEHYSGQFLVSSNADGRFQIPNNVAGYRPMSVHTSDYYCVGIKDNALLTNEYYSVLFTVDATSGHLVKVPNAQIYIDVFYQRV